MLNSRDKKLLRNDVLYNLDVGLAKCRALGCDVLVTGTVRDDEYQLDVYNKGYSKAKKPTFHSVKAGLAFDVCKNLKGHEYDDPAFWKTVSKVFKDIGFTWGGDWTSIIDKPHFQWDSHGKYKSSDILAGRMPPMMPAQKDEISDIVNSIAKKYGLSSPQYWIDVINGKSIATKENLLALFKKFDK